MNSGIKIHDESGSDARSTALNHDLAIANLGLRPSDHSVAALPNLTTTFQTSLAVRAKERHSDTLQGYAKRHYTADEVEQLAGTGGVDIVLTHDAPAGVRFERHRRGAGYVSEAAGLDVLLARARPRVCFFGHHHTQVDAKVSEVRCIGLSKIAMPGNLVAIDIERGNLEWSLLGEFRSRRRFQFGAACFGGATPLRPPSSISSDSVVRIDL